jgi:hypothetical protein
MNQCSPFEPCQLAGCVYCDPYADVPDEDQAADETDETGETPLDRLRNALVDTAGLDNIPEPEPLVHGILFRDSLAWLYGAPGCGKSFMAIDIAGCIGTGEPWQGYGPAEQGQASNATEWNALVQLAAELRPALVVVDTQARVTVGMEENSAKEMGEFVHRVEQLRKATAACVLVVHHTGRGGEHMRGSIAMDGAATTMIKVEKGEDILQVECTKQKDAPEFDSFRLRLVSYEMSAVLSLIEGPLTVDSGHPAVRAMLTEWWNTHETDFVSATTLIEQKIVTKATFYRTAKALEKTGVVEVKQAGNGKRYRLLREPSV